MIDLNLEEAHLWEVSPKEPLHGGLLSGLRSEIQDTEAPQWRRGRGGGDFCGGSVKLPKSSCEPGNQWKSPLKSELSEMFKTPRRRGSWWLLLAFSWHSMTYRLFIFSWKNLPADTHIQLFLRMIPFISIQCPSCQSHMQPTGVLVICTLSCLWQLHPHVVFKTSRKYIKEDCWCLKGWQNAKIFPIPAAMLLCNRMLRS